MSQKQQQYSGGARLEFKMNLMNCKIGLKYKGDYPIEKIHSVIITQIPDKELHLQRSRRPKEESL